MTTPHKGGRTHQANFRQTSAEKARLQKVLATRDMSLADWVGGKVDEEIAMKKGTKVTAVHPDSGKWENATALSGMYRRGLQPKDYETVVMVKFDRDGYTVESPTIYTEAM